MDTFLGDSLTEDVAVSCSSALISRRLEMLRQEQAERGPITLERLVVDKCLRDTLSTAFLSTLSQSKSVRLSEEIRHQLVVVRDRLTIQEDRILRLDESDEVHGHRPTLVQQLVEGVLAVSAGLAEVNSTSLEVDRRTIHSHTFAIGLHIKLLDVRNKPQQRLAIRYLRDSASKARSSDTLLQF